MDAWPNLRTLKAGETLVVGVICCIDHQGLVRAYKPEAQPWILPRTSYPIGVVVDGASPGDPVTVRVGGVVAPEVLDGGDWWVPDAEQVTLVKVDPDAPPTEEAVYVESVVESQKKMLEDARGRTM